MDNSVINFIIFLIFTVIYFSKIRNKPTLKDYSTNEGVESYYSSVNSSLLLYFGITLLSQLITNIIVIMNMCGGSFLNNLGYTSLITFIPWTFIFGIVIIILIAFPNFKNAFADVVGYYSVSGKATEILTELLNHTNNINDYTHSIVNENMITTDNGNTTENSVSKLNKLQHEIESESSDLISEIFNNLSLLINKITPTNFNEYWNTLRPLMKSQYASLTDDQDKHCYDPSSDSLVTTSPASVSVNPSQLGGTTKYLHACMNKMNGGADSTNSNVLKRYCDLKQQFLDLVIYRDNIGEGMWYIYTGLLLSTILKYNINNRGCTKSVAQIQSNLNSALTAQQQDAALAQAQQRVYTVS
jgi:hypothetical protein